MTDACHQAFVHWIQTCHEAGGAPDFPAETIAEMEECYQAGWSAAIEAALQECQIGSTDETEYGDGYTDAVENITIAIRALSPRAEAQK